MTRSRTAAAGALVGLALAALLGGWVVTGWRGVRAEIAALTAAPRRQAEERAALLAAELGARLEELRAAEGARPYYEYQNLYHDPRGASQGPSVTPSPLARGPADPLIAVHFQIRPGGQVSVPTINEELPELSDPARLERDRRALASLRAAAASLRPALVAVAPAPAPAEPRVHAQAALEEQVQALDPSAYVQNVSPNQVYQQIQGRKKSAPDGAPGGARDRIEVRTRAFSWRTVELDGAPRLVALRSIETPDGTLTQGFTLAPAALAAWLAGRAGDMPARLAGGDAGAGGDERTGGDARAAAPLPVEGTWRIEVDPTAALAAAAGEAGAVRRGFFVRVVPAALLAILCGALVVLLVARAERLARQRSEFAAAAAHELRTPLAGLVLYGDMLAGDLGDPARRADYARRVSDEAARLGRVVGNVLGFTQLERRTLSVSARAGDAADAAREAVARVGPALEHAGVTLVASIPERAPARLDPDAVARILQNLLDNAEKYGRGAPDRTVELTVADAPGGGALIEVADRGPGVPRALARRLFTPFARGAGPDAPAGLGLGLALSRALAGAMGGELTYRGRDGGGALFALRLPPA